MKRKFLTDLGITDGDIIKQIIDYHQGVVQDLKDDLNTIHADLKTANKTITDLKSAVPDDNEDWKTKYDDLSKSMKTEDGEDWKTKYNKVSDEFETYKNNVQAKENAQKISETLRQRLLGDKLNPKYTDIIIKEISDTAELDDKGSIKNYDDIVKPHKEKYPEWFTVEDKKGFEPGKNTGGNSSVNPWLKENRNLAEQTKIYRENPALAREMAKAAGFNLE